MPKPSKTESGPRYLTFKLECGRTKSFSKSEAEVLIDEAIRRILGIAAPTYTIDTFDPDTQKCSLIVDAKDLHLIWAALSIYGSHFGIPVALHLNSIKKID